MQINDIIDSNTSIDKMEISDSQKSQDAPVRYTIAQQEDFNIVNGTFWEFLGTFLISYGYFSVRTDYSLQLPFYYLQQEQMQFGVAITVALASAFGIQQTGAHYNPAISISFTLEKRINPIQLALYTVAQFAGALVGGMCFNVLNQGPLEFIALRDITGVQMTEFFFQEMIGTFLLSVFYFIQSHSYCRFTTDFFMIVLDFFCAVLTSRTLALKSGGILNPALAVAFTLLSGWFGPFKTYEAASYIWIYILAPIAGAVSSYFFFNFFYAPLYQRLLRYQALQKR